MANSLVEATPIWQVRITKYTAMVKRELPDVLSNIVLEYMAADIFSFTVRGIKTEWTNVFGRIHGERRVFKNNMLIHSHMYDNGVLDGMHRVWHNGELTEINVYVRGVLE